MTHHEFPAFRYLNRTEYENFVSASSNVSFPAGRTLIEEGTHGDCMYFVTSGELRVLLRSSKGTRELARLSGPAVIGEMEFLTGKPRAATVETVTEAKAIKLGFDVLRRRVEDGDSATLKVILAIAQVVASRLEAMDAKFSELTESSGVERSEDLLNFHRKLFSEWSS